MTRREAASLVLLGALAAPLSNAAAAPSMCGRPEVAELVQQHYSRQTAHLALIANTAIEVETSGNRALCAVSVRVTLFNLLAGRPYPETIVQTRYFEIESIGGGLRVAFGAAS